MTQRILDTGEQQSSCTVTQRPSRSQTQRPHRAEAQQPPLTESQQPSHIVLSNVTINPEGRLGCHAANSDYIAKVAKAYAHIVEAWGLDDSEAEKLLAVDHLIWMQIKNGKWSGSLNQEQLARIRVVIAIHDALHSCFGVKKANRWATKPNRLAMFHRRKPVDAMIEEGLPMMERAQRFTYELATSA